MTSKLIARLVLALITLCGFFVIAGCATTERNLNMKVDVNRPGGSPGDLTAAYDLISSLKAPETILIVYDASGSMLWPTTAGGEPRFKNAHRSLSKYINGIPGKHNLGLLVYGSSLPSGIFEGRVHNLQAATRSCTEDIVLTVPVGKMDRAAFRSELDKLSLSKNYRGDTPIGGAIAKAVDILKKSPGEKKRIILITDGAEECFIRDGSGTAVPNAIAPETAQNKAKESGFVIDVVAFGVGYGKDGKLMAKSDQSLKSLKNLATGVFVTANTGDELLRALMQVEVENFKFELLDGDNKFLRNFTLGQGFVVDTTPYFSTVNLLKKRMKFGIAAKGERSFTKEIGVDKELKAVDVLLKLKSKDDYDPDVEPATLRWTE